MNGLVVVCAIICMISVFIVWTMVREAGAMADKIEKAVGTYLKAKCRADLGAKDYNRKGGE